MSIPMSAPDQRTADGLSNKSGGGRILWVGRVCRVKRPDLLLEIAKACPDLGFDVVGPVYDDEYSRSVARRAELIPNVRMLGTVARADIPQVYCNASLLCCTSEYEGFPNTFLEAWSNGLPIVSTFDPDGVIMGRGLGRIGRDAESLVVCIRELLADSAGHATISARAREYFLGYHSLDAVMPRFERLFFEAARVMKAKPSGSVRVADCF